MSVTTTDKNNAGETKRTGTKGTSGSSHSSSPRSSSVSLSHEDPNRKYKHKWSYQERLDYALAAGMSREKAEQWARSEYSDVDDAPTDFGLFRKTSSHQRYEENEAADMKLFNDLLDEDRVMKENAPSAEAERRAAAGINDALTGGKELGTGDATGVDDTVVSQSAEQVAALNSEVAARPGQVASILMSALGGIMNMINAGVDIKKSLYDMDIKEGESVFTAINNMSDLGNFFPFLGISYDPHEDTWLDYEEETDTSKKLDTQYVYGLPRADFMRRLRKRMPYISDRYAGDLYSVYKSMASPKGINSYMQERLKNIETQNKTIDEQAKGVIRTGGLMQPSPAFGSTGLSVGSKFGTSLDRKVYDKYIQNVSELESLGIASQKAIARNEVATKDRDRFKANIESRILDNVNNLVNDLRRDASAGSALANYLLVNMMSGSFNNIGQAAWMFQGSADPQSLKDLPRFLKDIFGTLYLEGQHFFRH